jgi:hypothetical protein
VTTGVHGENAVDPEPYALWTAKLDGSEPPTRLLPGSNGTDWDPAWSS